MDALMIAGVTEPEGTAATQSMFSSSPLATFVEAYGKPIF